MVSGQSAFIEAVEELPYKEVIDTSEGGAGALTTTEFKRVGVKLDVSAVLTDNNNILLTVDAEQNVATGVSDAEVPIIDTRKAKTSLLLKNGQVVILGGLRRQEKTQEVDQIPIVGDLPIIGELFKSTNTVVKNSELIVFLSPHIYKREPIPDDAMAKFKEIKDRPILSIQKDRDATKEVLLKKLAEEKAQQTLETGNVFPLPPMGNYERYVVHDCLKDFEGIETASFGEGADRRVEIRPVKFGRGLKKIMKKIKLF